MQDYSTYIQYNEDNSVKVPFGRAAEWYIANHPLLKNRRLKCQSRQYTPGLVKKGIINVERVEGAVDFVEWTTKVGKTKSTNRVDDILTLTSEGHELLMQINAKEKRDRLCWSWVMFCAGDGNSCQRVCGGIGKCKEGCKNFEFSNRLKNYQDMHLCQVRVKSEVHLSSLTTSHPLLIEIHGTHAPLNIIVNSTPKIERLNLLKSVRDNVLLSRRADHRSAKGIKSKLLASMNGANEGTLSQALTNQRTICTDNKLKQLVARDDRRLKDHVGSWTILHNLIVENLKPKGYILYYQQPNLSFPEDSPQRFYQLTLSDEFWLKNTRDYGQNCIGIDGKYDLNIDHVPVLSIVAKNNASFATPIAFGKKFTFLNNFSKVEIIYHILYTIYIYHILI